MSKFHLKTGDTVVVIAGKDKGKKGKVLSVDAKTGKILVEKVGMVIRHSKPRRQGDVGGIIHQEAGIAISNVMHICKKCGEPTRIGYTVLADGGKVRVCKKCNENFDD